MLCFKIHDLGLIFILNIESVETLTEILFGDLVIISLKQNYNSAYTVVLWEVNDKMFLKELTWCLIYYEPSTFVRKTVSIENNNDIFIAQLVIGSQQHTWNLGLTFKNGSGLRETCSEVNTKM